MVASPHEATLLRGSLRPDMLILTPGIQVRPGPGPDEPRVATPGAAIRAGATHIVAGRAITGATDPLEIFEAVCQDLEQA